MSTSVKKLKVEYGREQAANAEAGAALCPLSMRDFSSTQRTWSRHPGLASEEAMTSARPGGGGRLMAARLAPCRGLTSHRSMADSRPARGATGGLG
ncbi:unnamed protein product [Gadus morhua 'NCC']